MSTTDTRASLLRAAEQLFADRGVEAVSLREIARSAGAKNVIAVQYHFADREGVVQGILDKHLPAVDARMHALLDAVEHQPPIALRDMAGALVRPLSAKLADSDGGPAFLRVYADLLNRPTPALEAANGRFGSLQRWRVLAEPILEPQAVKLHARFNALLYTCCELARRAEASPHTDDRLFTSHLIDIVAAILSAPVSDETRLLSRERDARRAAARKTSTKGR